MRFPRLACPIAVAALVALLPAAPAAAQETLKMNISVSQNSHYGVAVDTVRPRSGEANERPLQGPEFLLGRAGRRARVHRGRAARHARPHDDVDRPGAELRAGDRDPRHPVPVPRLRPRAQHARRPDRAGHAGKFPSKGIVGAGLGRERLSPHDQQQALGEHARRPEGPQDAHDGEPGPHAGVQARSASSPRRWRSPRCSPRCSRARSTARRTRCR